MVITPFFFVSGASEVTPPAAFDGRTSFGPLWAFSGFSEGAQSPVQQERAGGAGGRKRVELSFVIEIDGEYYYFASLEEALLALQSLEPKEQIEEKAERDAKRIVRLGRAKAKPKAPRVVVKSAESREDVSEIQRAISRAYWRSLANALGEIAEEEEDIIFIAGLDID